MRRSLSLAAVLALAMAWVATPVTATTLERFHSTQPYDDIRWDCGYPMRVVGASTDTVVVRADKQLDGNVFATDAFSFSETWTAADGRWFALRGNQVFKDVKAKPAGGSVYTFTLDNPGQMAATDSSGNVVYRDRGLISYTYTIDLATGAFTPISRRVAGPHPSVDVEMCKAVAPLVGTDSARYLTPRPLGSTSFSMGYYEYLPPSYSATGAKSPLLVAFNGYGENGDGTPGALSLLLNTGIPRFINVGGWPTDRQFVVLAAQHVQTSPDLGCTTPDEIHGFIDFAVKRYNVDPTQVYATGLSCGAIGTWQYLAKYGNEQVAAAVPIAGDGREAWETAGCGLASVPLWAFHGELDDVVSPQGSIVPMNNLRTVCGASSNRAKLTIYPGLYHDGWDQAYSGSLGDDIYSWMLGFSRP